MLNLTNNLIVIIGMSNPSWNTRANLRSENFTTRIATTYWISKELGTPLGDIDLGESTIVIVAE